MKPRTVSVALSSLGFEFRLGDGRAKRCRRRRNFNQLFHRLVAKELVNAVGEFIGGRRVDDFLRWRGQHELLIRVGQRVVRDERSDVAEFSRVRLEKFLARGNAVKKIGDADGGARR